MEFPETVSHNPKKMLLIVALISIAACGCHVANEYFNIKNDHPVEQMTEAMIDAIIESHTGIKVDIDLTPGS